MGFFTPRIGIFYAAEKDFYATERDFFTPRKGIFYAAEKAVSFGVGENYLMGHVFAVLTNWSIFVRPRNTL
jgi:hypothetical protein